MIRGISPVYGKRLAPAFGEAVFDVIEAQPERLQDVDGIGPNRAERIAQVARSEGHSGHHDIPALAWREHVALGTDLKSDLPIALPLAGAGRNKPGPRRIGRGAWHA
jgi:hypothetical protein